MDDEEFDSLRVRMGTVVSAPWEQRKQRDLGGVMDVAGEKGNGATSSVPRGVGTDITRRQFLRRSLLHFQ